MVAQDRVHVDLYTRQQDGHWVLSEASRLEDALDLRSIGCKLALADLYEKVDLAAPDSHCRNGDMPAVGTEATA